MVLKVAADTCDAIVYPRGWYSPGRPCRNATKGTITSRRDPSFNVRVCNVHRYKYPVAFWFTYTPDVT